MIIYKTTNLINGKIYIGKDSKNDSNYLGSGKLINYAIKKYGKCNFQKEILEECTNNNWKKKERYWIKKLNSINKKIGYNITKGGDGFEKDHPVSLDIRRKISIANTGRKRINSKECRENISKALKGHKLSSETKDKISKAHRGKILSKEHKKHLSETRRKLRKKGIMCGSNHPNFGKHLLEETKKELSEKNSGENNPMWGCAEIREG